MSITIHRFVEELPLALLRALAGDDVAWATDEQTTAARAELERREASRAKARAFAEAGGRGTLPQVQA